MVEKVQGKRPTLEQLLLKISDSTDIHVQEKTVWLKNKIRKEFADPQSTWIKGFLKCVTGQTVLPAQVIEIRGIDGNFCKAHTCFNFLDVPFGHNTPHIRDETLSNEERFIKNLELTMDQTRYDVN